MRHLVCSNPVFEEKRGKEEGNSEARAEARTTRQRRSINGRSLERIVIDLYNTATGELLGSITEADLQVLVDALEEEGSDDQDYYIDAATIDVIGDGRATDHLLRLLRTALGDAKGVDIRWNRR